MNLIRCGTSSPSGLGLSNGFCNSPFHSSNILRGPEITSRTYLAILDYITVVKCIQDLLCQKTLGDGAIALKRCNRFEIDKGHIYFFPHISAFLRHFWITEVSGFRTNIFLGHQTLSTNSSISQLKIFQFRMPF